MLDYFLMIFWVIVAVIGLVLYANPSFWVRHMYEGFETVQQQQPATAIVTQQQQQTPMNVNSMLRNLEQLINTPGHSANIPDVRPVMPSAEQAAEHKSNTGRQQPKEAESTKSSPQAVNQPQVPSSALEQGRAFQQTKPKADPTPPVKEIIRERIVEVPVPRTCPRQQACPVCPTCPDMQQYIRKDSIPCWACKL